LLLLGHEDDAEAAFADLLQELVRADDGAGAFGDGLIGGDASLKKAVLVAMGTQQTLDSLSKFGLVRTYLVQKRKLLGARRLFQGTVKQFFFDHGNSRFASIFLNEKRKRKAPPKNGKSIKSRAPRRAARRVQRPSRDPRSSEKSSARRRPGRW